MVRWPRTAKARACRASWSRCGGTDASQLMARVEARLTELKSSLPAGVRIVPFYNRSALIERAVGTVTRALMEATVLVVILLLLFLGEWRASVVVASMLPFASLLTFLLMQATGQSANLMSLGGLASPVACRLDATRRWWWSRTPWPGSAPKPPVRTCPVCTGSMRRARLPRRWPQAC